MTLRLAWLLLLFSATGAAIAHEARPALLDIRRDREASVCHIVWKQPTSGEIAVHLMPRLSGGWIEAAPDREVRAPEHRKLSWDRRDCTLAALEAQSIVIEGLDVTITDASVRVDYGDGETRQHILRPGASPLPLARTAATRHAVSAYFGLGIEHILEGIDHLAFVLAFLLLVNRRRRLVLALSGFTIGHSFTLAATTLSLLQPWPAFIETLVALSILFVAGEVVRARQGVRSLTARWPELAALGFGLLHGLAFAGALAEIGLPQRESLSSLLLFNLGVEVGQLLFIAIITAFMHIARPLLMRMPSWTGSLPPYAIGAAAAFWFIERGEVLFA